MLTKLAIPAIAVTAMAAVAAIAIGAMAFAPKANASLLAQYSVDGGATFTPICSDVSGGSCSSTFTSSNGISFLAFGATSNSPGSPVDANLFSTSLRISNPTALAQAILLSIGDTDFTAPLGSVTFLNNVAGTVTSGGAAQTASSIACLDQANGQNTCPATYQTPVIVASVTTPGAGSSTTSLPIANLTGPYSMTELISLTLAPGGLLNYVSSSDVVPTPEPASLAILGAGLIGMGLFGRRRLGA